MSLYDTHAAKLSRARKLQQRTRDTSISPVLLVSLGHWERLHLRPEHMAHKRHRHQSCMAHALVHAPVNIRDDGRSQQLQPFAPQR